jgi:acylglycerol lipase
MASTTDRIAGRANGPDLLVRHWTPSGEPWASLLIVHGLGEHSGRYEHVGEAFANAGIDAYSYDQRGFGGSGGRRAHTEAWSDTEDDLEARLRAVRQSADGRPVVLYGHSLGGLIALAYTLGERPRPDLLVLSAPGLEDRLPGWKKRLAGVLDRATPTLRVANGIARDQLVRTPRPGFVYTEDPLVEAASTVHLGALGFATQERTRELVDGLHDLPTPTLVLHGGDDPIVPLSASARLERFEGVHRIVFQGYRHEVHNEAGSPVVEAIVDWMRTQVTDRG